MRKAVIFDDFAYRCPYFNSETDVNNGYGCDHPEQENTCEDEKGNDHGCCFCCSCPLGVEAEQEDADRNENIDWDELCTSGEVSESEYLLINIGEEATEDEKKALYSYERYMHRYDKTWLDAHNIANSLCK